MMIEELKDNQKYPENQKHPLGEKQRQWIAERILNRVMNDGETAPMFKRAA